MVLLSEGSYLVININVYLQNLNSYKIQILSCNQLSGFIMSYLISIIIPTYNRAHLIGQTLDSIKNQSYKNWECLIVDDRSNDYTAELLNFYTDEDKRFKYIQRPDNLKPGANSCRNLGFENSKGIFINWFDSDDIMHCDKLSIQLELLSKTGYNMCVCQTMIFENDLGNTLGLRHPQLDSIDPLNDFICNKIKWLTQSPLIRRSFIVQNNLNFDINLHQSQEWDYFVRLLSLESRYISSYKPLVYLRKHVDSISFGEMTPKKIMSFFYARHKALNKLRTRLNALAINNLKDDILWAYTLLLQKSAFQEALIVKNYIKKLNEEFSLTFRFIQLEFAFYSFKIFCKGEKILKFNRE